MLFLCLFNPYPAKADCDITANNRRFLIKKLFNPYPAKADCDKFNYFCLEYERNTFQPISSESGLRQQDECNKNYGYYFSTHIQRKRIATQQRIILHLHILLLFNPYPAKADCDTTAACLVGSRLAFQPISSESGLRLQRSCGVAVSTSLFNPYPAKADCDWVAQSSGSFISYFSTHIQRKRIATMSMYFIF